MPTIAGYLTKNILFESSHSVTFQGLHPTTGRTVLIKLLKGDHPQHTQLDIFKREYNLLSTFDSPYIIKTFGLERHNNSLVIVLEDCLDSFSQLSEAIQDQKSFDLQLFLQISVELTRGLETIHDNNVIYGNLNPSTILINNSDKTIKYFDFSLATGDEIEKTGPHLSQLPETVLPYIAPEQTGRLDQTVDHRADLYSLGVTLFQIITGSLPFAMNSIDEMIHAHLAKTPPSASHVNRFIPPIISAIITKLLNKNPARRYQNCQTLFTDLSRCLHDLDKHGAIEDFIPGEFSQPDRLELSSHLYHREKQLQALREGLERVTDGSVECFTISGPVGVGTTSLVHEFHARLPKESIYFLEGRFEEGSTPLYSVLSWIIQQLVRQILSENSEQIRDWKSHLQSAAEEQWGVLAEIAPEIEHLLGPQKPGMPVDAEENERRYFKAISHFLQVCSHNRSPLIFFLDDIHFADMASLHLLEQLVQRNALNNLLIITTCREDSLDPGTPLEQLQQALVAAGIAIHHLPLDNLKSNDVEHLLSITLSRDREEVTALASICFQKTQGNPHYLKQFLYELYREKLLFFSPSSHHWEWHHQLIKDSLPTPNAADLLVQKLTLFSPATLDLLKTASSIGETFSLEIVASLYDCQPEDLQDILHHPLEQGAILISHSDNDTEKHCYHFAHEQIRNVLLAMLRDDEQSAIHLRAGKHLLHGCKDEEYLLRVEEIADHLNRGSGHCIKDTDKVTVAQVNLDAGKKAQNSHNHLAAYTYIVAGVHALPPKSWKTNYQLTLGLYSEGCMAAFLCGKFAHAEQFFEAVKSNATGIQDKLDAYRTHIRALKAQNQPDHAITASLEILTLLGVTIPYKPTRLQSLVALLTTRIRLIPYNHHRILALPELTNNKASAILGFLHDAGTLAYITNPLLLPILCKHAIYISLKYGNNLESSIIGYLNLGVLLCSLSGRYINHGYDYGLLALQLQERLNSSGSVCLPIYAFNSFIKHWKEHLRNTIEPLRMTINGEFGRGDHDSAANAACSISFRQYLLGTNLNTVTDELRHNYQLVEKINQHIPLSRLNIMRQAVANLQGDNHDPLLLKGLFVNEDNLLPEYLSSGDYTSYCIAFIIKMVHAVIFNEYSRALSFSHKAKKYLTSLTASAFIPVFYFYDSIARLAIYDTLRPLEKLQTRLIITVNQHKMRQWAHFAPENCAHKYNLVEAERQRLQGNSEPAMELYEKAIYLAHENEYIHEEALAYELAARYYSNHRKPHIARPYLREARYCYYRWGATAKVRQLDGYDYSATANTTGSEGRPLSTASFTTTFSPGEGASRLDMLTVIKASRILSSEVVLDELLKKMMHIMLESSGAQRGFLIFKEENEWVIRVRGSIHTNINITLTRTPVTSQNIASTAVINYVTHSGADVVLHDACQEGLYTHDSYIIEKQIRSLLCMPIVHQNEIFCLLYLENNLASGAFPADRQELLHLLGTQGAISLKNSSLFEELEETVGRLNAEVEKRRSAQQQLLHAEKLSALGRLSASIAHEFGNPLMGVKYLLDDFHKRKNLGDSDRQLLDLGLEECERMKKLIKDLQLLNKPSSGKLCKTDIHSLIENALLFQKKLFSSKRIQLKKNFDRTVPEVEVIADQITQVLFNLTMNAVDAMGNDGGTLSIVTRHTQQRVVIEVTDTGAGIPFDKQEQVFEPFFSTKKEEDGTGLGLSISYGIARHHGGDLNFTSTPGHGTTFTLSLPTLPETSKRHEKDWRKSSF